MVENVRFYGLKLQIAFSEALYDSIRTDLRLIEALQSLQIESRHLLDHCEDRIATVFELDLVVPPENFS